MFKLDNIAAALYVRKLVVWTPADTRAYMIDDFVGLT